MTRNEIEYWKHQEQKRANEALEYHNSVVRQNQQLANWEIQRANKAREAEQHRYNSIVAEQNARLYGYQMASLSETARSNRAREAQAYRDLAELNRTHRANESISTAQNAMNFILGTKQAHNAAVQAKAASSNASANKFSSYSKIFGPISQILAKKIGGK